VEADVRLREARYSAPIQQIALLFGLVFLAAGIGGFIPGITTHYDDLSFAGHGSGAKLLDVFQVSVLHNLVHLLFGVAALVLARTRGGARAFLVGGGLIYLALFLYGLFTSQDSGANFIPLDRNDDILHLALGFGMLVFGLLPESVPAGATDTLAGLLAAAGIFVALTGVAYRPLRLVPAALLLSLLAVAIGGRNLRLATFAVFTGAACFAVGMAVAVVTSHPLW
jgi:Domain of unknown function (DUF4383)